MKRFFLRHWYGRVGVLWLLWPLAALYALIVGVRRMAYQRWPQCSSALPVKVLVVGNISVGGTGKTPMVLALIEHLRACGWHPGVVSRGYGGRQRQATFVRADSDPAEVGDEPLLLVQRSAVPLVIGRDRVAAARHLLATHAEVDLIISDDGLQHYRLRRDVEIVLYDAQRGLGNAHLLPLGPLREPAARAVGCLQVWTSIDAAFRPPQGHTMLLHAEAPRLLQGGAPWPVTAPAAIAAFAGIGNPERFFASVRALGFSLQEHAWPDHHRYRREDFAHLDRPVLMTEKDAVKCRTLAPLDSAYLPVTAALPLAFWQELDDALKGRG